MIYAIVTDNQVVNLIVAEEEFAALMRPNYQAVIRIDDLDPRPEIGWSYDGSRLNPPTPPTLDQLKADKLAMFDVETTNFILSRYSLPRQSSLQLIRGDARADGLTNRFNYINQVVGWVNSVLQYHFETNAAMNAAADIPALNAITWDFAPFLASDPNVWIENAMEIPD